MIAGLASTAALLASAANLAVVPPEGPVRTDPTSPPSPTTTDPVSVAAELGDSVAVERTGQPPDPERSALGRHLSRPVGIDPRFLNHGVVQVGAGFGWPHVYRLQLGLGLLDHLAGGATLHWLPGQPHPRWAPWGSVAFWRARRWAVGAHYRQVLHPPPREPYVRPGRTPAFQERSHYVLATVSFSQAWWSAGGEMGAVQRRLATLDPADEPNIYEEVWRFGGGVFLRFGTERWGITAQAHAPALSAELLFDVRLGAFELRASSKGWRLR